ncbi:nitroreductase family protein [Nocardiopsis potens]|uniref:nitroreductase family protein n=1 Tax=Nocardiopsis potens TaxID=1246458 RepID=UPI00034BBE78
MTLPDQPSDFMRVLLGRSAVRDFTPEAIDPEVLRRLLDAMIAAPSAGNVQAWAFVAVQDPRTLKLLRAFAPGIIQPAPLIVAACFDRSRAVKDDGEFWDEGLLCVAMAVENLLLAAHSEGLGGCPVASFRRDSVQEILELPKHLEPIILASIGHPARPLASPPRRDRSEVIRHETWGNRDAAHN